MGGQDGTVDRRIAAIASAEHGNVARWQLLSADVSARSIEKRLDKGWLIGVHRGVYRVGHRAPSVDADYMAAVLACGEGARLSGKAAAWLLELVKGTPARPEVTAPSSRVVENVETHRERHWDVRDGTIHRGIPVTTPARTLVDLTGSVSEAELARAFHEAGVRYDTTPDDVEAVLARRP